MNLEHFINNQARKNISDAVARAEAHTAGEIVPIVIGKSDPYPGAHWRCALLFVLIGAALLRFLPPYYFVSYPFELLLLLVVVGDFVGKIPQLKRLTLFHREVDKEVAERALFEFNAHKIGKTRDRTGILIYVSLFEHRVMVLADEGINSKVQPGTWDKLTAELTASIKQGDAPAGLTMAISRCGEILAQHFPRKSDDKNELPNQLIIKE